MRLIALAALAAALALPVGAVHAQSADKAATAQKKPAAKPAAKTAAKPAVKKATTQKTSQKTVKKAPAKKATAKGVPAKTAKVVEANTPTETLTKRLTDSELALAHHIHTGKIQCELGADVTVTADEKNPGFFYISTGKRRYYMHPVESRTGALRMEDGRAGAMWLQLGNKSMLMDQRAGQRVADECVTAQQRIVAEQMKANPMPGLLDGLK